MKVYGVCPVCGDKVYISKTGRWMIVGVLLMIAVIFLVISIIYPNIVTPVITLCIGGLGVYQFFFERGNYCVNCENYPYFRLSKIRWFKTPREEVE